MVFILTVLLTLALIGRLAWVQIVLADELHRQAWEQWNHNISLQTARGLIYDRNGNLLAGNVQVKTVAAIPMQVEDPQATAEALAAVLKMDSARIKELVTMEKSSVYIKRRVDEEVSEQVREMELPGIVFFREDKRDYPGGNLASQLLGFVGMDRGLAGIEAFYEGYLRGGESSLFYPADGRGRQLPHHFNRGLPALEAHDLILAIDETIQHIVEKEMEIIFEEAAPERIMALAVDPWTGAVLAAAARPDYNPAAYEAFEPMSWSLAPFNASFEPGSTFKLVALAAAIEEGLYDPEQTFFCPGYKEVAGHRITCWTHDRGGHGTIDYHGALAGSCNPTFIEIGRQLGVERLFQYIEGFGFGRASGIDYPGESTGLVFSTEDVGELELATTAFGQGVSVTPIQQAMAVSAMINGGYLLKPYLVEEIRERDGAVVFKREPEVIRQVVSEKTSALLREMMDYAVLEGTGVHAASEIYNLAGKTGTAEKIGPDGTYMSEKHIYSLVGFAPVEDPRVVLYVAVDGVTMGPRFGLVTSAPMFRRIMEDTLNYLQVPPLGGEMEEEVQEVQEMEDEEH